MADDDQAELPVSAGIAAVWGMRERPVKGPRPTVGVTEIVDAAVRIADTDGLAAVSMSKVAAEVGVTAMALYRHIGNKDELLVLMLDAGVGPPAEMPPEGQDWREGLQNWATEVLATYRRRPWVMRIPITTLPPLPNQMLWMENGLRCLRGTGLSEGEKLASILLLSNLMRGYGLLAAEIGAGAVPAAATFAAVARRVLDDERFPALAQTLTSGALEADVPGPGEPPPEADLIWSEMQFGLDRVLDGISAMIERA
ncbi:TetR/AcrR family transcriptional regulator [Kineosporia rhizophila]|uniref:TetR/AcrR family transcriptional regulator n=1 Tax=Kineosporia TaxID=49184 RepID=UPI001E64FFBE|nr:MULTISPECIES: TetR/AcrR family transcriptional regulator [Kineosporia]MCE0534678.1 TetR/AcrR family transcriptional regulator [Kineosporia rhizophila]GLY19398.1 TetR family transcriptional regulator [Kineosporia sp. NBRC 101677]